MNRLVLNVYRDENMEELKRTVEADKLKIPYRVMTFLIQSLDDIDIKNDNDIIRFITHNIEKLDKIVKATFQVTDNELDCIDGGELIEVLKELYRWGLGKISELKSKN